MTPCPGCKLPPVDVGTFGRHKFACLLYVSHDRRTTDRCVGSVCRPSYHSMLDAEDDWEESVRIKTELETLGEAER